MRDWLAEWGWPIVGAVPFVAWYIWLDQYPSVWGAIAFNVVVGGAAGAAAVGTAVASQPGTGQLRLLAMCGLGFGFGAWCNLTLPWVLEFPIGAGHHTFDVVARAGWTATALCAAGLATVWGVNGWVRVWASWGWVPVVLFVWAPPGVRGVGGALFLVWCAGLAGLGARARRG